MARPIPLPENPLVELYIRRLPSRRRLKIFLRRILGPMSLDKAKRLRIFSFDFGVWIILFFVLFLKRLLYLKFMISTDKIQ